jgi:Na+/H+ antiporter NhaD/arsenite permease-like protein
MWIALGIFIISYYVISTEKFPRHWVSMLGGSAMILLGVISPVKALSMINWETLGLLIGMFTLVSILVESGFFYWLAFGVLKKVSFNPTALFISLIAMASILSMFMDSITVMLFLSALSVQLCRIIRLDPIPLVIAEVCAANTGGAATLVGDPPNVILGTSLGFSFMDFVKNTGPLSILATGFLLIWFFIANRKQLKAVQDSTTNEKIKEMESLQSQPLQRDLSRIGVAGFVFAVVFLIFHQPISVLTGLPINSATAALVPAIVSLASLRNTHFKKVILKVDGESILFFCGLFMLIGGLESVRLFQYIADWLAGMARLGSSIFLVGLHWVSGILSGIVDNVPLALAMSYVMKNLASGKDLPALAIMVWSLALGVDIGGNMTPLGASANVVAYSVLERSENRVGWGRWLRTAIPPTLITMCFLSICLLIKNVNNWY